MPVWLAQKLFQKDVLRKALNKIDADFDWKQRLLFTEHHLSHAASAFFASPFEEAATLTMDGVGERATTSIGVGQDNRLELHREIHFPHSLGSFTPPSPTNTGFKVNSGEYKLMGLAPTANRNSPPSFSTISFTCTRTAAFSSTSAISTIAPACA